MWKKIIKKKIEDITNKFKPKPAAIVLPDFTEIYKHQIEKNLRFLVADKFMESFSFVDWEPPSLEDEVPNSFVCYVKNVSPATLDDNEWTLIVTLAPRFGTHPAIHVPLTEFLTTYKPCQPITFKYHDA